MHIFIGHSTPENIVNLFELRFHVNASCNYLLDDKWRTLIDTVGCKANEDILHLFT